MADLYNFEFDFIKYISNPFINQDANISFIVAAADTQIFGR